MRKLFLVLITLVAVVPILRAQQLTREILYVGTYSERGSQGIYVLELDRSTAQLQEIQTYPYKSSPTFLETHPGGKYLYAVYREGKNPEDEKGTVASFSIDPMNGKISMLNEQSSEGRGPCHISLSPNGKYAFVSNYVEGNLAVYPVRDDGTLGPASDVIQHEGKGAHESRQNGPHMHSTIPSRNGKFVYASDLGIDKIMIYTLDENTGKLHPASMPYVKSIPAAGPRHFTLHPDENYAFSIEEISSTIAIYSLSPKSGKLKLIERVSTLPEGTDVPNNTTADIHVSPDGKFVYGSNRGHDSIVAYAFDPKKGKMTYVEHQSSGGERPRNFCVDQGGEYVFVANRNSDNLVVFGRDADSGQLDYRHEVEIPGAVCIKQLRLR